MGFSANNDGLFLRCLNRGAQQERNKRRHTGQKCILIIQLGPDSVRVLAVAPTFGRQGHRD